MEIKITLNSNDFRQKLTSYSKAIDRAQRSAVRRAVKSGVTALKKEGSSILRLKQSEIKKEFLREKFSGANARNAEIIIRGKVLPLSKFLRRSDIATSRRVSKTGRRKPGIKVKVYKKRPAKLYKGAFFQETKFGPQVLIRKGEERHPTKRLFGVGLRELYQNKDFEGSIRQTITGTYQKRFVSSFEAFKVRA